ncbi:MAG TPA: carboxymuconolactone decarboxylase family protein [Alphaproteobacteria bacterium]|nr:carboxymuconolactone decarboxylase family protein [Alphaproteobacteria bacterium]
MSLDILKSRLPDFAKDLRLNLGGIPSITSLSPQQLWGTVLATAIASRNADVIRVADAAASEHLTEQAKTAARSAAAIMAMNNIYYRFTHLSKHPDFLTMPARLRMNVIANPGVEKIDFELWSLAVSAVNGCGRCIEAHEDVLLKAGVAKEAIQDAIRIAAIVFSVAVTLDDPLIDAGSIAAAA